MDDSLWTPNSSPTFHGSASSMVNFEDVGEESTPESRRDEFEAGFHQPAKKRRLSHDQVRFLEKSFEVENKLEPERKIQLAKEIGLQPRQVAIWFQNRRARYKTKVLEREYGSLKASYDELKLDYDALLKENERIKNEVNLMREKVVMRENEKADPRPKMAAAVEAMEAKSDVLDSDSSHCNDGNYDCLNAFEGSDFSQEEDDQSLMVMRPACLEMECCDDLQPNSGNLGFPVQDQGTWFWHI